RYREILGKPAITKNEWAGLDKTNSYDKLAHDVFQTTKQTLLALADSYEVAKGRKELFKQAINSQFSAFTVNVTLGQYGGVLTAVESVENPTHLTASPTYLPQFSMAPSLLYGVLKDLFGEDQGQDAFKKLVGEFGGDIGVI